MSRETSCRLTPSLRAKSAGRVFVSIMVLRNLFTGALSERLDNKKLVFELNEGSLNLRIF